MKILNVLLRIFVGTVFLVSAVSKLFPIEPFEVLLVNLGVANWLLVPFMARIIISFELFLGLCIVFNLWFKNKIYYLTQATLIIFSVYLVFVLVTKGNTNDCGCFGNLISLTPIQSLFKNLLLILALIFIKRNYYHTGLRWVMLVFIALSLSFVFLINRVGIQNAQAKALNEKVDFSGLPNLYGTHHKVNFQEGKKIVVFLSVTCIHCKNAAYRLATLNHNKKTSNLYLVIASLKEKNIQPFLTTTKLTYPFIWMNNDDFFHYSGGSLPAFVYLENGVIKKKWTGEFFDIDELKTCVAY